MKTLETALTFDDLGLSPSTLEAIKSKGFTHPTPIQEKIIPLILQEDVDVVGQAQTGTGKTAAFGLPLIETLTENSGAIRALILVPTRELAVQVAEEINSLKGKKRLQILSVYGGQSYGKQLSALRRGVDIVVGTPGRIIDHLKQGTLKLDGLTHLILDEADEMLNMGFIDDVEEILSMTSEKKRVLLLSATMPQRILSLAERYMGKYKMVKLVPKEMTTKLVEQRYYLVREYDKKEALARLMDSQEDFYGIIFCQTKMDVDDVASHFENLGYRIQGIHGDFAQHQREKILDLFRRKKITVLVATDVAARGLDIQNLTHVINYSLPNNPESYVHRIGRTGRSGRQGTALSLVNGDEMRKLNFIRKLTMSDIRHEKLPTISEVLAKKSQAIIRSLTATLAVDENGETPAALATPATPLLANLVKDLMQNQDPEKIIQMLLSKKYGEELNPKRYKEIREEMLPQRSSHITSRNSRSSRFASSFSSGPEERSPRGGRFSDTRGAGPSRAPYGAPAGAGATGGAGGAKEKVRLYIGRGKIDQCTPKKLVNWIGEIAKIPFEKISDVQIYDNFSFLTVPAGRAQDLLAGKRFPDPFSPEAGKDKNVRIEIAR